MANTSGDSGRLVRKNSAELPATRLEPESALISAVKKIEGRIHGSCLHFASIGYSPGDARDLPRQRPDEPAHSRASRSPRLAGQASGRQRANHRCDIRPYAQRPPQVAAAFGATFEAARGTRSQPLHAKAGSRGVGGQRETVRQDA